MTVTFETSVRCGNHAGKVYHNSIQAVRECYANRYNEEAIARIEDGYHQPEDVASHFADDTNQTGSDEIEFAEEDDQQDDTCHCGHPECGAC